jgi:hypothetical protein
MLIKRSLSFIWRRPVRRVLWLTPDPAKRAGQRQRASRPGKLFRQPSTTIADGEPRDPVRVGSRVSPGALGGIDRRMTTTPSRPPARRGRRLLIVQTVILVVAALVAFPAAADTSGGANHVVIASATADGSSMSNSGVQTSSVGSPTVTSDNIARAQSQNCTGCRADAAALQAVFITRNANTVTPGNAAVAVNSNCTHCDSFAFAFQYVVTTTGPVYLSGGAQQQIAQIRAQVGDTIGSGLPDDQLDVRLRDLATQFKGVIDQGLQEAGAPANGTVNERVDVAPAAG